MRFALTAFLLAGLVAPFQAQAPYRILVTNDDGVRAPGLQAVAEALKALGEVTIVAPADNQSGKGTSLSLGAPILREDVTLPNGMAAIGLTATPATTMRVALMQIVKQRPDLVVSGINRGMNLGLAAYISGTVGAARDAVLKGIPAIASSLAVTSAGDVGSYTAAAEATVRIVAIVKKRGLPRGLLLNVNVPEGTMQTFKGIRVTTQGTAIGGGERFEAQNDPTTGRTSYRNMFVEGGTDVEGTDTWAVQNGYVAVTPLKVGEFDRAAFDALKNVIK